MMQKRLAKATLHDVIVAAVPALLVAIVAAIATYIAVRLTLIVPKNHIMPGSQPFALIAAVMALAAGAGFRVTPNRLQTYGDAILRIVLGVFVALIAAQFLTIPLSLGEKVNQLSEIDARQTAIAQSAAERFCTTRHLTYHDGRFDGAIGTVACEGADGILNTFRVDLTRYGFHSISHP